MPNDNLKILNWTDGEGITAADLNATARYGVARAHDAILEKLIPGKTDYFSLECNIGAPLGGAVGDNVTTGGWAYCLTGGQAYPRQGSGNNKVQIAPGTLLQKIGARDGNEATLLSYTFTGTEEVTIANGDPTNPRVDIVQMKLEWESGNAVARDFKDAVTGALSSTTPSTHRRVLCTLSVKTGTPAASPAYPVPDAGYVPIAGVVVPATWAAASGFAIEDTAGVVAVLHDQRMPIGTARAHVSVPNTFLADVSAGVYTLPSLREYLQAGATPSTFYVLCPSASRVGRVVGIKALGNVPGAGASCGLGRYRYTTVRAFQEMNNLGGIYGPTWLNLGSQRGLFEANHYASAPGPTVAPSVGAGGGVGVYGPPVWTNGKRAIDPDLTSAASYDRFDSAAVFVAGLVSGDQIGSFTWWVAEGL